jgi:PAS domain S-box-containing protein
VVVEGLRDCLGVVATDLSERRSAEQRLRLSEAQFRGVFENSALGKRLQSNNGEVKVNKAFCDLLGYTEEELQAKDWRDITHPEDITATQDIMEKLQAGALSSGRLEKRYLHRNGAIVWADVSISMGRDAAGEPLYILTTVNDITARKQADAALTELKQHLQRNIEMERLRLAQDLHDVPLQQLYGVIYKLEELRARALPLNMPVIEQAIADIQKTLSTLRSTASELRPPALSRFGLEKAIRSYVEDFREKHPDMQVNVALARDSQMLPEAVRLVLFRVLQESLANIVRHAQATQVDVRFEFDAEEARLRVSDNGKGFRVPDNWISMVHDGHYGLAGMVERVTAAGGTLDIQSAAGSSTTVLVVILYNSEL